MEKISRGSGLYWMRRVELSRVRDTLLLVARNSGMKSAKINEQGIKEGVFRRKDGTSLRPTPIYHYINTAFRFGLLVRDKERCYSPNWADPIVGRLVKLNRFLKPLESEESLLFQKLIIRNADCRKAFFWVFLGKESFSWEEFVQCGCPVFVSPTIITVNRKKIRTKKYENKLIQQQLILESRKERFAVEWGLQLWAKDCSLIDEIYIYETQHILYPLNLTNSIKFEDFLKEFLKRYQPSLDGEWRFFPIDLVIFNLAPLLRVSVEEMQARFLLEARRRLPEYIKFSSSSKGALTFRSSWEKTDAKVLRNFLKVDNFWVTHIIVHKKLWEIV
jgi:hypothetical protein